MREHAVREENIMIAILSFNHMYQDSDEPIWYFSARIKGKGDSKMDYIEEILRNVLARGLNDNEIQQSLLSDYSKGSKINEENLISYLYQFIDRKKHKSDMFNLVLLNLFQLEITWYGVIQWPCKLKPEIPQQVCVSRNALYKQALSTSKNSPTPWQEVFLRDLDTKCNAQQNFTPI